MALLWQIRNNILHFFLLFLWRAATFINLLNFYLFDVKFFVVSSSCFRVSSLASPAFFISVSFMTNSVCFLYPLQFFLCRCFKCLLLCVASISPLKDQKDNKIKNDVTGAGGNGVTTIIDKKWRRAEGVNVNRDITVKNKENMYKFLFLAYFWSAREQLSFGRHSGGGVVSSIDLSPRAQAK